MSSFSFTVLSPSSSPSQAAAAAVANNPRNLKLTDTDDLDVSTGNLQLVGGAASIPQDLRIRLKFFKGEWFLDRDAGVPFFQDVLVKNPDPNVLQSVFRKALLETPGVLAINDLSLTRDSVTRKLNVSFRVSTDAGVFAVSQGL